MVHIAEAFEVKNEELFIFPFIIFREFTNLPLHPSHTASLCKPATSQPFGEMGDMHFIILYGGYSVVRISMMRACSCKMTLALGLWNGAATTY
jgi:hypothetical protein